MLSIRPKPYPSELRARAAALARAGKLVPETTRVRDQRSLPCRCRRWPMGPTLGGRISSHPTTRSSALSRRARWRGAAREGERVRGCGMAPMADQEIARRQRRSWRVVVRQDPEHSLDRFRGGRVDSRDPSAGDRGLHRVQVGRRLDLLFIGVRRHPGHLGHAVEPRQRLPDGLRPQLFGGSHRRSR